MAVAVGVRKETKRSFFYFLWPDAAVARSDPQRLGVESLWTGGFLELPQPHQATQKLSTIGHKSPVPNRLLTPSTSRSPSTHSHGPLGLWTGSPREGEGGG